MISLVLITSAFLLCEITNRSVRPPFGDPHSSLGREGAPKETQESFLLQTHKAFYCGAPDRNVSHAGDSGFDHEAWKLGVFIEKEWGWGRNWRGFT